MSQAARSSVTDDAEWADRCSHWASQLQRPDHRRSPRRREQSSLILCGHGVSIRVDGGSLVINNGFSHYPQTRETYRFFRGDLSVPSRIILLDGSGTISFDVLSWLTEQEVPLVRIDWQGHVQTVLGNSGYAANPHRVAWQVEARADPRQRMAFCIGLITRKLEGCIRTLEKSIRRSPAWEKATERAYADLTRLECDPPRDIVSLRALEAGSAAAYFRAWRAVPLRWLGTGRRAIPASWRAVGSRTSLYKVAGNRNAAHPVNAMLNYGYAVLESQIRIQLVSDGFDPTRGIMHERREGSSAFVFDMMEPERPKVDRAVLELVKANPLHAADFTIRADGVCRLNPEMARFWCGSLVRALVPTRLPVSTKVARISEPDSYRRLDRNSNPHRRSRFPV